MGGIILRLKQWWEGADRTQRLVTLLGGGFLILLLAGTFMLASRPKMSMIFSNLTPADAGNVVMEIETMGVPVQLENGGNVLVPSDRLIRLRADLARANKLPKSSHAGMADLKDIGMMNTPSVEKERLRAITEGDLAQSIEFFDGVDSAQVHVSLGTDSAFVSEKHEPQASVTISEAPGATVSQEQGRAMANLVASSVAGLDAKKVTIFSRDGRAIYDGSQQSDGSSLAGTKLEMQHKIAEQRRTELQQALDRVFGTGNTLAMISDVRLNTDEVESTSKVSDASPKSLNETKIEETMSGGGSASNLANDVFGANTGESAPGLSKDSKAAEGYRMSQVTKTHLENVNISNIKKGVGDVVGMSITVFANSAVITDQTAISQTVSAYLGPKAADSANYTAQVVWSKFDDSRQQDALKAGQAAKSAATTQTILSMLPMIALVIVALVVMRQIGKFGKTMPMYALATPSGVSLPMPNPTQLIQPQASLPQTASSTSTPASNEVLRQRAIEAGISEEAIDAAIQSAAEEGLTLEDIPSIQNRINVPLEQIKKMGEDRPEVVAMLLKSWMLEERR